MKRKSNKFFFSSFFGKRLLFIVIVLSCGVKLAIAKDSEFFIGGGTFLGTDMQWRSRQYHYSLVPEDI